jgi:hypothetical protein
MKLWFGLQINADGNPVIVSASTDKEAARNEINEAVGSRHMLQPIDIQFLEDLDDREIAGTNRTETVQ